MICFTFNKGKDAVIRFCREHPSPRQLREMRRKIHRRLKVLLGPDCPAPELASTFMGKIRGAIQETSDPHCSDSWFEGKVVSLNV